jgi:hypothetical protein
MPGALAGQRLNNHLKADGRATSFARVQSLTEKDIRGSFVNCSKGEAQRMNVPRDLADLDWDTLDFLGWRDPGAPERAYLVAERDPGLGDGLTGVALRATPPGKRRFTSRSMCSLCLTTRTAGSVTLMTARRAGPAGRQGNSVGQYLCTDLACSLYARGLRAPAAGADFDESLTPEEKVARMLANLGTFLDQVTR